MSDATRQMSTPLEPKMRIDFKTPLERDAFVDGFLCINGGSKSVLMSIAVSSSITMSTFVFSVIVFQ
jgi:hypothetical protein